MKWHTPYTSMLNAFWLKSAAAFSELCGCATNSTYVPPTMQKWTYSIKHCTPDNPFKFTKVSVYHCWYILTAPSHGNLCRWVTISELPWCIVMARCQRLFVEMYSHNCGGEICLTGLWITSLSLSLLYLSIYAYIYYFTVNSMFC